MKKRQSPLISVLIILVGAMGGYMYFSGTSDDVDVGLAAIEESSMTKQGGIEIFENTQFDFSVVDDANFQSLRSIGDAIIDPGITGRDDIFRSF